MSLGSLGIVGGFAASQAAQRTADTDKAARETSDQSRTTESVQRAEQAAGVGQTDEFSESTDRDADGRQLWQRRQPKEGEAVAEEAALEATMGGIPIAVPDPHLSKDPHGEAGSLLDLQG